MTRYLVLTRYGAGTDVPPMAEWSPDDIDAHIRCPRELNQELIENGELVEAQGLTGPELARVVTSGGGAPVVTDGPFAEVKEMLAGYQVVDVESEARAIEIAARLSAAPGPGGVGVEHCTRPGP